MSKKLVIVESPTKARTLGRFLGNEYQIEASMGHVRDLPKAKLGVDVERDFEPAYVIPKNKRKVVENLKHVSRGASEIILATDPDREGEAIAWHVGQLTNGKKAENFKRIVFHEITKEALQEAIKSPRKLNLQLVDAQVARRVLDRLVGYKLSPLLWFKVKKGLSAGRVQSVVVRLIVEREREILQFKPEEYWSIIALLREQISNPPAGRAGVKSQVSNREEFEASLMKKDDKKIDINNEKQAKEIVTELGSKETRWKVEKSEQKDVKKYPAPPFTTSTMTQGAANTFGFTSKKTMKLAQDLYEEGIITYHRTDSVSLAPVALSAARKFITEQFGKEYLPPTARVYKTKSKLAQEAHEAVRPTRVEMTNDKIQMPNDHKKIIWSNLEKVYG